MQKYHIPVLNTRYFIIDNFIESVIIGVMRIKIKKRAEVTGGMPACEFGSYVSGQTQAEGFSIPIEYTAEGELMRPMRVGESLLMMRDLRNGVPAVGIFQTSPVIEITQETFMTNNSVYDYEVLTPAEKAV
jgi:hypothetical protein